MSVQVTQKKELLNRVGRLIEDSQGTEFVIPDDTGLFSIEDDLVGRIRALVRQTADLMLEIMECYDSESEGTVSEDISASDDEAFLKEIGAQIASQMAVEEVSGLAFVSRGQLLDTIASIDSAIASKAVWKVASTVDAGLRRSGRALVAMESAIRECEGLPVRYRAWQNLDDSLEVRRIYGEFRRAIFFHGGEDPVGAPASDELTASLRHAAESIAKLRGLEIYPYLRIDDRLQIRQIQTRILEWFETDGSDDDGSNEGGSKTEAGSRLWGDLVSFARLLGEVNHRQELREHDRLAVNGLCRRFFDSGKAPEKIDPEILGLLDPLLARDDELDRIILDPESFTGRDLRAPLERLRKELGKPFETRPLADFLHSAHS